MIQNTPLKHYQITLENGETFPINTWESVQLNDAFHCKDGYGNNVYIKVKAISGQEIAATTLSKEFKLILDEAENYNVSLDTSVLHPGQMFIFRNDDGHDNVATVLNVEQNIITAKRVDLTIAEQRN